MSLHEHQQGQAGQSVLQSGILDGLKPGEKSRAIHVLGFEVTFSKGLNDWIFAQMDDREIGPFATELQAASAVVQAIEQRHAASLSHGTV